MKKHYLIFIFLFILVCTYGQNISVDTTSIKKLLTFKSPKDFSFVLKEETEMINSQNKTLIRQYISKDSTIKIDFTQKDLDKVYSSFIKNGLDTLPEIYKPHCDINTIPAFHTYLIVKFNGVSREIRYFSPSICKDIIDIKRMKSVELFMTDLRKVIRNKKAYNRLKRTNITFE